jgi:integrase
MSTHQVARRRSGRGTVRRQGKYFVWRGRLEAPEPGQPRPWSTIKLGLVTELRTKGAARIEADRLLDLMGIAGRLQGTRVRFADYLDAYLAGRVAVLKPASRAAFHSYARHLRREFAQRDMDDISIGVAQRAVANLSSRGLARSTITGIVSFLRRMLRTARQEGIAAIDIGPRALSLPKRSAPPPAPRCFTLQESARILEAATWPWRALFALQAFLGLRAGESLGLEWSHIDFDAKVIRIRQQASHGRIATTKSTNSAAAVPLPDALAELLKEYATKWVRNDRGLLFANGAGEPLWSEGVRRNHLTPLLKRLGIAHGGFHAWRHALATEAFRAGVGAAAVRQLLRHGSIAITMKYSHVSFDDLVNGSNAVAQKLRAASVAVSPRCADGNSPATGNPAIPHIHTSMNESERTRQETEDQ